VNVVHIAVEVVRSDLEAAHARAEPRTSATGSRTPPGASVGVNAADEVGHRSGDGCAGWVHESMIDRDDVRRWIEATAHQLSARSVDAPLADLGPLVVAGLLELPADGEPSLTGASTGSPVWTSGKSSLPWCLPSSRLWMITLR